MGKMAKTFQFILKNRKSATKSTPNSYKKIKKEENGYRDVLLISCLLLDLKKFINCWFPIISKYTIWT